MEAKFLTTDFLVMAKTKGNLTREAKLRQQQIKAGTYVKKEKKKKQPPKPTPVVQPTKTEYTRPPQADEFLEKREKPVDRVVIAPALSDFTVNPAVFNRLVHDSGPYVKREFKRIAEVKPSYIEVDQSGKKTLIVRDVVPRNLESLLFAGGMENRFNWLAGDERFKDLVVPVLHGEGKMKRAINKLNVDSHEHRVRPVEKPYYEAIADRATFRKETSKLQRFYAKVRKAREKGFFMWVDGDMTTPSIRKVLKGKVYKPAKLNEIVLECLYEALHREPEPGDNVDGLFAMLAPFHVSNGIKLEKYQNGDYQFPDNQNLKRKIDSKVRKEWLVIQEFKAGRAARKVALLDSVGDYSRTNERLNRLNYDQANLSGVLVPKIELHEVDEDSNYSSHGEKSEDDDVYSRQDFMECVAKVGCKAAKRKCLFDLHPDKGGLHDDFVWGNLYVDCCINTGALPPENHTCQYVQDSNGLDWFAYAFGFAITSILMIFITRLILIRLFAKFEIDIKHYVAIVTGWHGFYAFNYLMKGDMLNFFQRLFLMAVTRLMYYGDWVEDKLLDRANKAIISCGRNVVGAGKGNSFLSALVKNKGTGGKSKLNRPMQPPLDYIPGMDPNDVGSDNDSDGSEFDEDAYEVFCDKMRKETIFSDFPNSRSLSVAPNFVDTYRFDCYGAPFCGVVCIDIACRIKPNVDKYLDLSYRNMNIVPVLGDSDYLKNYAASKGVNLIIYDPAGTILSVGHNDPTWLWVSLQFEDSADPEVYGHYVLRVNNVGDSINFKLPDFPKLVLSDRWMFYMTIALLISLCSQFSIGALISALECFWTADLLHVFYSFKTMNWWFCSNLEFILTLACGIEMTKEVVLIKYLYNPTNVDVRPINARREKLVHHDYYAQLRFDWKFRLRFLNIALFPVWWTRQIGCVSVGRLTEAYDEGMKCFASGRDFLLCLPTATRLRELNTRVDLGGLLSSSRVVLEFCAECLSTSKAVMPVSTVGLVQWNDNGNNAILANLANIAANQVFANVQGAGSSKYGRSNYVKKFRLTEAKTKPCNVAPIGCFVTDSGALYPGLFNVTDSPSLLAAFCGRSMAKDLVPVSNFVDFIEFYQKTVEEIADAVDFSGICDYKDMDELVENYRKHNIGKKSQADIDTRVRNYRKMKNGQMTLREHKKFTSGSCFVKYEANTKKTSGKYGSKPRLIMTMPDSYTVELVGLLEVHDLMYKSAWGKKLVKHLDPDEMIKRIYELTCLEHNTTDYSSFECSISEAIRICEVTSQCYLLNRAGLFKTCSSFKDYLNQEDTMITKYGEFIIHTRRSGDYDTGYSNAMSNYVLAKWMAKLNNVESIVLVEGDDGLMRSDNLNVSEASKLGFKLGTNVSGVNPGDVDFLCSRWVVTGGSGKRLLNVGKMTRSFWVKEGANLTVGKQKFILRAMALSLHALSPGHPILFALVNRVLRLTSGVNKFRNWEKYVSSYNCNPGEIDLTIRRVSVDDSMRSEVAQGGVGFPGIPIYIQKILEDRLNDDTQDVYIGKLLDDYDEVMAFRASAPDHRDRKRCAKDQAELWELIGDPLFYLSRMSDTHENEYVQNVLEMISDNQDTLDAYVDALKKNAGGFKIAYGGNDAVSKGKVRYHRNKNLTKCK